MSSLGLDFKDAIRFIKNTADNAKAKGYLADTWVMGHLSNLASVLLAIDGSITRKELDIYKEVAWLLYRLDEGWNELGEQERQIFSALMDNYKRLESGIKNIKYAKPGCFKPFFSNSRVYTFS